ncbi:MAG: hypothetical protein V3T58_05875 [Candidatus Hydrothermarchaeales archaeon]
MAEDRNEELFKLAITAEKTVRDFYLNLIKKFSELNEVSEFWKGMVRDEIQHIQELSSIHSSLTMDQLFAPADPALVEEARKFLKFSFKDELKSIETLEDAYQVTHKLEYSEINTVYNFLLMEFVSSDEKKKFAMTQLKNHLKKIDEFPSKFL